MIRLLFTCLVCLSYLLLSSVSGYAAPAKTNLYYVTMQIFEGERIVGEPKFLMESGSTATVIRADENGYSLRSQIDTSDLQQTGHVKLSSLLYLAKSNGWVKVAQPNVTMKLKSKSSISVPGVGGGAVRIEVSVSDDFSGKFASTQKFGQNKCTAKKLARWSQLTAMPVKASIALIQSETVGVGGAGCCSPCSGMTCCSSGPICCSDSYVCPGGSCCN